MFTDEDRELPPVPDVELLELNATGQDVQSQEMDLVNIESTPLQPIAELREEQNTPEVNQRQEIDMKASLMLMCTSIFRCCFEEFEYRTGR